MVAVTRDGWEVRNQDCPRFFRPQHLLSLPEPVQGGDVMDLYKFVPVESEDEKLLMMTWTIAGLYAAIPTPILVFVGQQGSAKTTRSRRLRSLLDPSITPVLGDLEMSDLFLTFQHHAVPCFENVSSLPRAKDRDFPAESAPRSRQSQPHQNRDPRADQFIGRRSRFRAPKSADSQTVPIPVAQLADRGLTPTPRASSDEFRGGAVCFGPST